MYQTISKYIRDIRIYIYIYIYSPSPLSAPQELDPNPILSSSANAWSSQRGASEPPGRASIGCSFGVNAGHSGHPHPSSSSSSSQTSLHPWGHGLSDTPARTVQDGGATPCFKRSVENHTYIHTPVAATTMYVPSIVSSNSRLHAHLGRTSLSLEGKEGTPAPNMPEPCHARKRLDTELGNSVELHPPKTAKKAHFPDEGDIDDSAGNRRGIPLVQISQDLSQPPIG